jgi:hypothetical protein
VNLPRMSLHIGDYLKDTRHLRALEHGAYFLLIMHYWTKGGLPDDDRQLSAIACMSDKEWKKARPSKRSLPPAGVTSALTKSWQTQPNATRGASPQDVRAG